MAYSGGGNQFIRLGARDVKRDEILIGPLDNLQGRRRTLIGAGQEMGPTARPRSRPG